MRKALHKIYKSPVYVLVFLIFCIFSFPSLDLEPESVRFAIVSTMGIDKESDEIEVTLLVLAPKANHSGVTEKYILLSSKGKNLSEAIDNIGVQLGKEIVLGHMFLMVVSDDATDENIAPMLDFLVRSYNLGNRTLMVNCSCKAKDLIKEGQKMDDSSGFKLNDLIFLNEKYVQTVNSNLEDFYTGILSPTNSSLITFLNLTDKVDEGVPVSPMDGDSGDSKGQSSGSSSGNDESAGGSTQKPEKPKQSSSEQGKIITNNNGAGLFKGGKKIKQLSSKEVQGLNWILGNAQFGHITVEHLSDEELQDATVTFSFFGEKVKTNVVFENGKPIISFDLNLILSLEEVKEKVANYEIIESQTFVLSEKKKAQIENKIKKEFADTLQILKENKCDVLSVYQTFEKKANKPFKEFLDQLEDKDDYLNYIIFLVDVNLHLKV